MQRCSVAPVGAPTIEDAQEAVDASAIGETAPETLRDRDDFVLVHPVERLKRDLGDQLCHVDLLPIGAHRRNWKATLVSDGYLILRTPSVDATAHLADRVAEELQIFAA